VGPLIAEPPLSLPDSRLKLVDARKQCLPLRFPPGARLADPGQFASGCLVAGGLLRQQPSRLAQLGLEPLPPTRAGQELDPQLCDFGVQRCRFLGQPIEPSEVGRAGIEFRPDTSEFFPECVALRTDGLQLPLQGFVGPGSGLV
jgi:hypothetical protein